MANIDLRKEIGKILRGDGSTPGQGQPFVLRHVRTDANKNPERCVCYDKVSGDVGLANCTYCNGLGYLFDESLVLGYLVEVGAMFLSDEMDSNLFGVINTDKRYVICEHYVEVSERDMLLELDFIPNMATPQQVDVFRKWDIERVVPFRGDNGRIEYLQIVVETWGNRGAVNG